MRTALQVKVHGTRVESFGSSVRVVGCNPEINQGAEVIAVTERDAIAKPELPPQHLVRHPFVGVAGDLEDGVVCRHDPAPPRFGKRFPGLQVPVRHQGAWLYQLEALFKYLLGIKAHDGVSLNNASNSLRFLYGSTHLGTKTTSQSVMLGTRHPGILRHKDGVHVTDGALAVLCRRSVQPAHGCPVCGVVLPQADDVGLTTAII